MLLWRERTAEAVCSRAACAHDESFPESRRSRGVVPGVGLRAVGAARRPRRAAGHRGSPGSGAGGSRAWSPGLVAARWAPRAGQDARPSTETSLASARVLAGELASHGREL